MKTDSETLLDLMIDEGSPGKDTSIESDINKKFNEAIKKMQDSFSKKLEETEEKISNILKEKEIKDDDEEKDNGSEQDSDIPDKEGEDA